MIIYSISTAIAEELEERWVQFMRDDQIPLIMQTELFLDYRFSRVITAQGTDVTYNLQLRCEGHAQLSQFRGKHELPLQKIEYQNFEGKYASFQSVLEQVDEGS